MSLGRKFLGHFIRHFGPQISPKSFKQGHISSSDWFSLWMGESSVHDRLFCRHQHSGSVHGYSETRSRSNVWKEHTHTEWHKYDKTHTFCCKFWVYSLRMALFGWFWWYLWPKMAYKMSQEFPTDSMDITRKVDTGSLTCAKILTRVVYTNARQTD